MKKRIKALLAIMIAMVMFAQIQVPVLAAAEEDGESSLTGYNEEYFDSYEEAEAAGEEIAAEASDSGLSAETKRVDAGNGPVFYTTDAAAEYLRKQAVNRVTDNIIFEVNINGAGISKSRADAVVQDIYDKIFDVTSEPNEGDYLLWHMASYQFSYTYGGDSIKVTTCKLNYLTTKDQETSVLAKAQGLMSTEFAGWQQHTDAYNTKKAYDWIRRTFSYDDSLKDHTAYGGMFGSHKTVCQGYASTNYLLLRMMGIDNRIVASKSHGWNIVRIGGLYYNVDATWGDNSDTGLLDKYYFLTNNYTVARLDSDGSHTRKYEYSNSTFNARYPMSTNNYYYDADAESAVSNTASISVDYATHIQNVGWEKSWRKDGQMSGTSGRSLRLEGIKIQLEKPAGVDLGVEYKTHIQNIGWESTWRANGTMSGTSGRALRLEAIRIRLTGADASRYNIYYRVHAQNYGWLDWAKNGAESGTAGQGLRLEGIQIMVRPKGMTLSSAADTAIRGCSYVEIGKSSTSMAGGSGLINYTTHVQNYGWQGWVHDGSIAGTTGEAKRLEGIKISLGNTGYAGAVYYRTHIQNVGWENSLRYNGAMSGTSGRSLRLEAIQIKLDGAVAEHYDVYYRVHAQNIGWLGWAKNAEPAGTEGYAYRLEGIQIVLMPKVGGSSSYPSINTRSPFYKR